jgi:hypothetical protein
LHSLLFFCALLIIGCTAGSSDQVLFNWQDQKPVSVLIPEKRLPNEKQADLVSGINIRLKGASVNILTNKEWKEGILLEPFLPFTTGLPYYVFFRDVLIDSFTIPLPGNAAAPKLLQVWPSLDSLPMNTLKIYLQFSQPMRENVSAKYVQLLHDGRDTLNGVFLDLQPELWNEDRTVLTLWFDPGRIKRDLQPNQRMGNPLEENKHYTLFVSKAWTSAQGLPLQQDFKRSFIAGVRDSLSPDPAHWQLGLPAANSKEPLTIELHETLDHYLLQESLQVNTTTGKRIEGKWLINEKDNQCSFQPSTPWPAGNYQLRINAKLEDLAGNNLNKPFDRDITKSKAPADNPVYKRSFTIR